jgi:hypothetical protein
METEMKANRIIPLLIIAAIIAVTGLTFREAVATSAVVSEVNSATHSYSAWAQAVESEANSVDSATHSYTDWAKSVEMNDQTVDSATHSYTEWAKSVESGSLLVPVTGNIACNHYTVPANLDSATRSYVAWAYAVECR